MFYRPSAVVDFSYMKHLDHFFPARLSALAGLLAFAIVIISSPLARGDERTAATNSQISRKIVLKTPPAPLPDIPFFDAGATPHTFGDFRGKGFILNIWATWCIPCRREMPTLNTLAGILRDKHIPVLALSVDRAPFTKISRFIEKNGFTNLKVFQDVKGSVARKLDIQGLPTTLVVDNKGREIGRVIGIVEWDDPENIQSILGFFSPSRDNLSARR